MLFFLGGKSEKSEANCSSLVTELVLQIKRLTRLAIVARWNVNSLLGCCAAPIFALLLVANIAKAQSVDPADEILSDDPADAILEGDAADPAPTTPEQPKYVEEWQDTPPPPAEPEAPVPEPVPEVPPQAPEEPAVPPVVETPLEPVVQSPPPPPPVAPAPPVAAVTEPEKSSEEPPPSDIADQVLDDDDVADGSGAPSEGADVADEVLATAAATAPADVTDDSGYEELRKTINAPVQIYELDSVGEMRDGLLIRRGRAGAKAAPAKHGFSGVFRAISADSPKKDSFRFGTHFGFYRVPNGWDNTTQSHLDSLGYFAYSVRDDMELRIAASAAGHHSGVIARAGQDALFQTLGDVMLGGKYARPIPKIPFLSIGGAADLIFYTQVGSFLIEPKATSFDLSALATLDLLQTKWFSRKVPVRVHGNLAYSLNQSSRLLDSVQVRNASTFGGFGMAPGDQLPFVVAGEYIVKPQVSVFMEYSAEPTIRQRASGTVIADRPRFTQSPNRMTFGSRWNPVENLTLDGALDFAYGFNRAVPLFSRPEPPGPPYELHFGFSYEWNPQAFEVIDLRGKIAGIVVDAETGDALGGAIIEYLDTDKYSMQVADESTGSFETYHLPPGEILIRITVEGYEPAIINPQIPQRQILEEKIFLRRPEEAGGPVGALVGQVVDEEGRPVTAFMKFLNADIEPIVASPNDGSFVKILPEGEYELEVAAEGYESKVYQVPIIAQKKTRVSFQLVSGSMLGALFGKVVDKDGRPLMASVMFLDAQIEPLQTDATGSIGKPLPPGEYKIEIRARGFLPRQFTVPIQQGRKTVLDIQMDEEESIGAFAGKILSEDGQPLAGIVTFLGTGVAPVPSDPDTGSFQVLLEAGTYDVAIDAPDYEPVAKVTIPVLKGKKTVQDFRLRAIVKDTDTLATIEGNRIVLAEPIKFEPGTTLLREDAYPVLESVAKAFYRLPAGKSLRFEVHTHGLGPSDANMRLSEDRADQIRSFLQSMGLPGGRIECIGRGEDEPIGDNNTQEGRDLNERVEITIR